MLYSIDTLSGNNHRQVVHTHDSDVDPGIVALRLQARMLARMPGSTPNSII